MRALIALDVLGPDSEYGTVGNLQVGLLTRAFDPEADMAWEPFGYGRRWRQRVSAKTKLQDKNPTLISLWSKNRQ